MKEELNFSSQHVVAIYAPNGSMKSSLAQSFDDLGGGIPPKDRFFPARLSVRKITDEKDKEISKEMVFVIDPYDREFKHWVKLNI